MADFLQTDTQDFIAFLSLSELFDLFGNNHKLPHHRTLSPLCVWEREKEEREGERICERKGVWVWKGFMWVKINSKEDKNWKWNKKERERENLSKKFMTKLFIKREEQFLF